MNPATEAPPRNLALDFFRSGAIVFIVLGHWLAGAVTFHDGSFGRQNPLVDIPWTQWLTWIFQVVPVFFLVAGYVSAVSWQRWQAGGVGSRAAWLRRRLARPLGPTAVYVALVLAVIAGLQWVAPGTSALAFGGWAVGMHLWFLGVYLVVVALTPIASAADRRWGLAVPAVLAAAVAVVDAAVIGAHVPHLGWLNYAFCWAAVYQLGIAWHSGRLHGYRPVLLAGGSGAVLATLLVWGPYPVSMIGVPGAAVQNSDPPTLAMLAFACAQAGLCLIVAPAVGRALRSARVQRPLAIANDNVMALYLWHMVPVVLVTLVGYPAGLLPQPPVGSSAWWLARLEWVVVLAVVTAAEMTLLWWQRSRLTAPLASCAVRMPRRLGEPLLLLGAAAAAVALSRLAADGFAPGGRLPLFTALLFAGGLILVALRPRGEDDAADRSPSRWPASSGNPGEPSR